jgi:dsRNA-specific ribonuclease
MEVEIPKVTQEFREFIISLLRLGMLTEKRIEEFTDKKSMQQFRTAFIHKSYGSEDNYELAELLGDVVVNSCIAFYLKDRFPEISSMSFITRLKHKYISKPELGRIAEREGFLKHILYGREMKEIVNSRNPQHNKDYRSMLEDTFESFIGTVVTVIDGKTRNGIGNPVACNIISSFINKIDISLDFEIVFDAKSRLKMVYDKPLGWEIGEEIDKTRIGQKWKATIYGYPSLIREGRLGFNDDEKPLRRTFKDRREVLAVGYGTDDKMAANDAAKKVLYILADTFDIHQAKRAISKKETLEMPHLNITSDFKELVIHFLKTGRVKEDKIKKFTDERSLNQFRYSFIHKSYGGEEMAGLSKYLGDVVIDNCIAFYIKKRFPNVISVKYLTRLKHNVSENDWLGLCVEDTGIFKYVLYGDEKKEKMTKYVNLHENEEYSGLLKGAFSSFIGTMVTIIDNNTIDGAGYVVAYNIVFHYLNKISMTLDYESVFSNKYRLKEVYDKFKWEFHREVETRENKSDKTWHTVIYGYPYGSRKRDPNQRVSIGEGVGTTKKIATDIASKNGLDALRRVGIREARPDPFRKN